MPRFLFTEPNGQKYILNLPEGTTDEQAAERYRSFKTAREIESYGQKGAGDIAKEAISNVPGSAVQFGKELYQTVRHPIDTATNLYELGRVDGFSQV